MNRIKSNALSAKFIAGFLVVALGISLILFYDFVDAANSHSVDLKASSSQYLSITDGSQTGLDLSGDLTFEAWVKFETIPSGDGTRYEILGKWNSVPNLSYHWSFIVNGSTLMQEFEVSDDGTNFDTYQVAAGSLNTGQWYHVAMTWDASAASAEFFHNGTSIGTDAASKTSIYNSNSTFRIGSHQGTNSYFDGLIDDVRVWSDIRINSEISNNYQSELVGNETNLVSYWKLNNDYTDQTTNGNTLTANNSPVFSTDIPGLSNPPTQDLQVFKSTTETITNDTTLSNDSELQLIDLEAGKTYIVSGAIFASTTAAAPDLKIAFNIPAGAVADIGFVSTSGSLSNSDILQGTGSADITSDRIALAKDTDSMIAINGTIQMGSVDGDVIFKWAQAQSNAAALSVIQGSYLLANEID
ncbi:MAG: hypothetical protein COU47_00845 [Candidatus Niyogibacteria bacterium CG10_big_fil_rev_8_21_14_0_10_46_36]|uniref:LamG-like jellyroll fold domain-containing protein n=1 Tax=Candidatus Niyogibacteria bacterium CG10_big_fil_rev_8_21_14_0_10_46_36 TaxID=1974726 RepID=A0A2H0TGM7_9BACT|nr:MAG: hypothetical protein COU47_00845 [Candidatus Niyogibacteria bacterium CG10_big_fil_rev_8_21_14_0_10_46_36]